MRPTSLLVLILPLSGMGLVSFSMLPERHVEPIRWELAPISSSDLAAMSLPIAPRSPVERVPIYPDGTTSEIPLAADLLPTPLPHPDLPVNLLLEECATPERFEEWHRGTSTERLCSNIVRIEHLLAWNPHTCSCKDSILAGVRSREVTLAHEMREEDALLNAEKDWLEREVRRQVARALDDAVVLEIFRLPRTEEEFMREIEDWTAEERDIQFELMLAAHVKLKETAIDAELSAGRSKVIPRGG